MFPLLTFALRGRAAYVKTALDNGAKAYNPPRPEELKAREDALESKYAAILSFRSHVYIRERKPLAGGLRFAAYENPTAATTTETTWEVKGPLTIMGFLRLNLCQIPLPLLCRFPQRCWTACLQATVEVGTTVAMFSSPIPRAGTAASTTALNVQRVAKRWGPEGFNDEGDKVIMPLSWMRVTR